MNARAQFTRMESSMEVSMPQDRQGLGAEVMTVARSLQTATGATGLPANPQDTQAAQARALCANAAFGPQGESAPVPAFEPMLRRGLASPKNSVCKAAGVLEPVAA